MFITELHKTNALDHFDLQKDYTALFHCCNCFCKMGSGIALQIARRYPQAKFIDQKTTPGDLDKLGTYTKIEVAPNKFVVNLYGQYTYGQKSYGDRDLSYDAIWDAMRHFINEHPGIKTIIVPRGIGCGLAAGRWEIVRSMLYELSEKVRIIVCRID